MPRRALSWPAFAAEVLELYEPPLRRKATRGKILQVLEEFGSRCRTARDLSPAIVAGWLRDHPARRPATVKALLSSLRAICRYGASRGYLRNPFDYRPLSAWLPDADGEPEPIVRHRSAAEIGRVLAMADREALGGSWEARRLRVLVHTLAHTGARAREILGLAVDDVDQASRWIRIQPNGRRALKTRASRRTLPVPAPLLALLGEWIGRADRPSPWLLPHGGLSGPWLSGTIASRALGHVAELGRRAGVPGLTLLAFRHSFATAAEGWGLGELAVMRLMGHSSPRTQSTYRHAEPEQLREAIGMIHF